jgi:hypothetical protein
VVDRLALPPHIAQHATPAALAVSPDSRLLVAGGAGSLLHVWDLAKGVLLHSVELPGSCAVAQLRVLPDSFTAAGEGRGRDGSGLRRAAGGPLLWLLRTAAPWCRCCGSAWCQAECCPPLLGSAALQARWQQRAAAGCAGLCICARARAARCRCQLVVLFLERKINKRLVRPPILPCAALLDDGSVQFVDVRQGALLYCIEAAVKGSRVRSFSTDARGNILAAACNDGAVGVRCRPPPAALLLVDALAACCCRAAPGWLSSSAVP